MRLRAGRVDEDLVAPNAERTCQVRRDELPLHCPRPGMYLWNSHPRVFLPVEETGEAKCPYCGAFYSLVTEDGS